MVSVQRDGCEHTLVMKFLRWLLGAVGALLAAFVGYKLLTKNDAHTYEVELLALKKRLEDLKDSELPEEEKEEVREGVRKKMEKIREQTEGMQPTDRLRRVLDILPPPEDDSSGIWG